MNAKTIVLFIVQTVMCGIAWKLLGTQTYAGVILIVWANNLMLQSQEEIEPPKQ